MEGQTCARKRPDVTVGFKVQFDEDQMPVNGCLVISVFKAKEDLLANTHTHTRTQFSSIADSELLLAPWITCLCVGGGGGHNLAPANSLLAVC